MPFDIAVDVSDIEELQAKLNRLQNVGAVLKTPLTRAASDIRTYTKEYPPATQANMPRPGHTHYVRGYGPVYVRLDGKQTGRKTSEMLNRKWSTRYRFTAAEAVAVIGNSASYAPYVHDERRQNRYLGVIGWHTLQATLRKLRSALRADFEQAIRDWLARQT